MFETNDTSAAGSLWLVSKSELTGGLREHDETTRSWLRRVGFRAERNEVAFVPGKDGGVGGAVIGLGDLADPGGVELWHLAGVPERLKAGSWRIENALPARAATAAALGWAYGGYRFDRYRSKPGTGTEPAATLVPPQLADMSYVRHMAGSLAMARDLINTPAGDMTPQELARRALELASAHGGSGREITGAALSEAYPAIHAVGRAAVNSPRLIDFNWGDVTDPKVTLVGKGVCFDSGGLDIKPADGMRLMKKDMGGAACTLALARMIMASGLQVRLRVLIPAVENAIAGDSLRPGDVIRMRSGQTVEVGNTDAEGRLVLADAITEAVADDPELIIDLATLTGAARIALGAELPALFGNRQATVDALLRQGRETADPLWQLPLWSGYESELRSEVADCNNVSGNAFAGAVIAGLFLRRFAGEQRDWLHVDLFGWNPKARPGRPVGAEAGAVRALYALLAERFG
jgi:leucyl aminopeptidase